MTHAEIEDLVRHGQGRSGRHGLRGVPTVAYYLDTRSFEIAVLIWVNAVSISLGVFSMKKLVGPLAQEGSTGDTPVPSSS